MSNKPINTPLQQFASQLHAWSEQIIENGRTPFRRVDLYQSILTELGSCTPPLVFWINRQSLIAGGLIFLPEQSTDREMKSEAAAATALGLKHFVTWETEQINIWCVEPDGTKLLNSFPLGTTTEPSVFHHRLYELIDQLKLLSVTGRIDYREISPYYLLNLAEECLELSMSGFIEHFRVLRSKKNSTLRAEEEAEDWCKLTLLRLLCILHWDLLPDNFTLDDIPRLLDELLPKLPEPLGAYLHDLRPNPDQPLPQNSIVSLHHLLLRLQQVGWKDQNERGLETLRLLLIHWFGAPKIHESPADTDRLMLHSRELAPKCRRELTQSGLQLAANTLWRVLSGTAHPQQLQGDAFRFLTPIEEEYLHANFYGDLCPDTELRRQLAANLRTSWPNRRFTLSGDLPAWVAEVAHTLGMSRPGSRIELHLPADWLRLIRGSMLSQVLFENFILEEIIETSPERHMVCLKRERGEFATRVRKIDRQDRFTELGQQHEKAEFRLILIFELPDSLYELYQEQRLVPYQSDSPEAADIDILKDYSTSRLGKGLWSICSPRPMPDQVDSLLQEAEANGWLIPDIVHLRELKRLREESTEASIDELLARLFPFSSLEFVDKSVSGGKSSTVPRPISRNLNEELLRQLEIDGIPHFPNTYLYRQVTGPLLNYQFTPPLTLCQEMLGQYELEDANGTVLHIEGQETLEALQLADLLGMGKLELPVDRQQTADMLDSYRKDLLALQDKINALCQKQIENPQAALRLQKKLWQQLPLPSLKWLNS